MWTDNQTPTKVTVKSPQLLLNVQDFPLSLFLPHASQWKLRTQQHKLEQRTIQWRQKQNEEEAFKYGQFLPRWVNTFLVGWTLVKASVHTKRGLYQTVAQPYFHTAWIPSNLATLSKHHKIFPQAQRSLLYNLKAFCCQLKRKTRGSNWEYGLALQWKRTFSTTVMRFSVSSDLQP